MSDQLALSIARQFETICHTLMSAPWFTVETGYCHLITGEPHPLGNFTIVSDHSDPALALAAIEPLTKLDVPSAAVFPTTLTDAVETAISEHGYALAEPMPAMSVELDRLARPELPPEYAFIEADTAALRAEWINVLAAGFGLPHPVAALFTPDLDATWPDRSVRCFAVMHNDIMVATSMLFIESGVAGMYCVATLPDYRGKGLASFATAEPLHLARSADVSTGILQSTLMGEPVYRKLGFVQHGVIPEYARMPVSDPATDG